MRRVTDRLFIGKQGDDPPDDTFATVRAAKHPWHFEKCGKVTPDNPYYFSYREGDTIALNIIDPPTPLFKRQVFQDFLEFAADAWKRGKNLLITCNRGESRAPSLALLFMAKCLGAIPDETYDQAWDAFEEIVGEYRPGTGIEEFLRVNWQQIRGERLPFLEGAAPKPVVQVADVPEIEIPAVCMDAVPSTPLESLAAIYNSPYVHFYAGARITDKDGVLTPADQHIVPNVFQARACEAYEWCVANQQPIRLVLGPKPRQSGGSTISAELCAHHTQRFKCSGMVIADENDRTDLVWNMFNRMVDNDRFKGLWGMRHTWNTEKAKFYYQDDDGTERELEWLRDTANDPKAGASGTRQILWCSEAGRYSKEGKVTDTQVISNASSSVPEKPGTMIILESTAEGASGYFYRTVKGAVTLEERMQGKVGNGWIKISCWWHECPDYFIPRTPANEEWFSGPLNERERRGVELYQWTAEQIAWRRKKIKGSFDGNEKLFDQEFPESEDVAFQSSGNPRFDMDALTAMEREALICHNYAEWGILELNQGLIQFINKKSEKPWLWVRERPLYGARYIFFADCMTGEQSAGSMERDCHAGGIWRLPYKDESGVHHDMMLACAMGYQEQVRPDGTVDAKAGIRWDDDKFAERANMVSRWYGNCIMAVEVNQALGVIRKLIDLGANLWKRTKADEASGIPGKTLQIPGWNTTSGASGTRSILVSEMAEAIREQRLVVHFLPMVHQLKMFVRHEDGSCKARSGEHDDWVMGPAIGITCSNAATQFRPPAPVTPTVHLPDRSGFRGKGAGALG